MDTFRPTIAPSWTRRLENEARDTFTQSDTFGNVRWITRQRKGKDEHFDRTFMVSVDTVGGTADGAVGTPDRPQLLNEVGQNLDIWSVRKLF